jgi:DNA-binding NtrC family response regulator
MRKYLIVDDNAAFAENLAEILADAGAEAVVATTGQEALALVAARRFDALVSDMRMPSMSGAEVVHRIRRLDPGLPALVITAFTADNELEAARHEGLIAVLPKPVPVPRLVELLGRARRDGLVALVEDDVALADNLTELLRDRGFAAVTAHTVLDSERLGVRPLCALVDLRLPGGPDGEAMRRLQARFPGLAIVVITGHANLPLTAEALRVFHKPLVTSDLIATVEAIHAKHINK